MYRRIQDEIFDVEKLDISNLRSLLENFVNDRKNSFLCTVRCGLHSFQLAVNDSLRIHEGFIDRIRKKVKFLRTPTMKNLQRQIGSEIPVIDTNVRMNSTYDMLQSFMKAKIFIVNNSESIRELETDSDDWNTLANILEVYGLCKSYLYVCKKVMF